MVRTQVQLTERQATALKRLAQERGCSVAELVRQGVDIVLARGGEVSPDELRARAAGVAGRFHSGLRDLARRHDEYLDEAWGG